MNRLHRAREHRSDGPTGKTDAETNCEGSLRQRQAREAESLEIQAIRAALIEAEKQGFSDQTPEQIKAAVIERRKGSGQL